jgi:SAM-dependent methyltransferase
MGRTGPDYATPYEQARLLFLQRIVPEGEGIAVDIGCNDGRITALVAARGWTVTGYDTDPHRIALARRAQPDLTFREGADDFTITDRALTTAFELLEHIPPGFQLDFLDAIHAATCPGGRLVLSTPGRYSLLATWERAKSAPRRGVRPYTWWDDTHVGVPARRRLHRLLRAAGWTIEQAPGFCVWSTTRPRGTTGLAARWAWDQIAVARKER